MEEEDRHVKLHYMTIIMERCVPLQLAEQRMRLCLLMSVAFRDLCGNKRLCLSTIPDPFTHPLPAPPAQSVTDQEQSAGPFLVV